MVRFRLTLGPMLCVVVAVAVVFGYAATGQFVQWDDPDMVVQNPLLNPPSWEKTAECWRKPVLKLYTPLAYSAWEGVAAMEHRGPASTLAAMPFHLLNLMLHAAGGIAVFLLLRELFESVPAALVGAMVFVVHPLQAEPVAWVAGMNGVLSGALSAAALWQYVVYAKSGRRRALVAATVLFAAALLSKPSAVVVPVLAAAIDFWLVRRPLKKVAVTLLPWAAMAIAAAIKARLAQPALKIYCPTLVQRLGIAADALGFYARSVFVPWHSTIDYERTPQWVVAHFGVAWAAIGAIVVVAVVLACFRPPGWLAAGVVIFAAGLAPVLGLVPFEFQSYSTVADRYMYLPMVGVAVVAAGAMRAAKGAWPWWLAGIVLVLLAIGAWIQTAAWHDTPTLAARQLAFDPDSATGHKIYAPWLAAQGQTDAAEAEYRAALAAMDRTGGGNAGVVRYDLGNLLMGQHRYDESAEQFTQAIGLLPAELLPRAYNNLGESLYFTGDREGARRQFQTALALQPDFGPAQQNWQLLEGK
jgi:protein O-mannosyl-transferase